MSVKSAKRTDVYSADLEGGSLNTAFIEWFGRILAALAIFLLILSVITMHRGKVVQRSAKNIVADFHTANDFFATRANFNSPTVVRQELETLSGILTQLNQQTITDVQLLGTTLPSLTALVAAGSTDVSIAQQVTVIGTGLQKNATTLNSIGAQASGVVSSVIQLLNQAQDLVNQLNAQLTAIASKLSIVPATG